MIEGKDWIYIFELKVDKSAQEALEQIKTKWVVFKKSEYGKRRQAKGKV